MKYQIVFQWTLADSGLGYDALVQIEDDLEAKLSDRHEIDGHDVGSDEFNIFILTDNPETCFKEVLNILHEEGRRVSFRVAYREVSKSSYTVLWPAGASDRPPAAAATRPGSSPAPPWP